MDQDPITAGGVGDGISQNEPDRTTQTNLTVENNNFMPSPDTHPVDSGHVDHDIELHHTNGKKAKSKTPLILGIVAGALALILAGIAVWFFVFYNNPDKVAYDAINHLITADHVSINGGFSILPNEDTESPFSMLILNIDSSSTSLPNASTANLLVAFKGETEDNSDGATLNLEIGTVEMADGVIYLQVSGIMDSLESLGVSSEDLGEAESFFSTLELIDNEWWEISIPDVVDSLELEAGAADGIKEIYSCAVTAINSDYSGEVANLYSNNRFVEVTPTDRIITSPDIDGSAYPEAASGHNLYEVTLNREKLASFVNAIPMTTVATQFFDCYNVAVEEYQLGDPVDLENINEISADEIETWADDLHVYLEISTFGHKLRAIHTYQYHDNMQLSAGFLFTYEPAVVSAPESYRPITELVDELSEAISQLPVEDPGYGWGDEGCYCPDEINTPCDCPVIDDTEDYDDYDDEYEDEYIDWEEEI